MVWGDVEILSSHKIKQRWVKVFVAHQGSIKSQSVGVKSGRVSDMVLYTLVALKTATVHAGNLFLVDISIYITAPTVTNNCLNLSAYE